MNRVMITDRSEFSCTWLTRLQDAVDAFLRDAVKLLDVVVAVPDPQFLSSHQRPTRFEVDVFMMLKRCQVPVTLLGGGAHKPANHKNQDSMGTKFYCKTRRARAS